MGRFPMVAKTSGHVGFGQVQRDIAGTDESEEVKGKESDTKHIEFLMSRFAGQYLRG
jgi:hypothetical protein